MQKSIFYPVFDFDGNIAQTFKTAPNIVGVNEACEQAVIALFGLKGEERLKELGGLRNRSPRELIELILEVTHTKYYSFVQSAHNYFQMHKDTLSGYVPEGKGYPFAWNKNDAVSIITELFIRVKLDILTKQIGTLLPNGSKWPEPCFGVPAFFEAISNQKKREPQSIQTAIISSGHDLFIQKVFEMWNIPCPSILLTDDTMRKMQFEEKGKPEKYMKPSPYLLEIVSNEFQKQNNGQPPDKNTMFYFGDDLSKDGMLAQNFGIRFGLFSETGMPSVPSSKGFTFCNWTSIIPLFTE